MRHLLIRSLSCVWLFVTPQTAAHQVSLPFITSWSLFKHISIESWCHPTISSSVIPFSSCLQAFPASESFPMSQLIVLGGQSTGGLASASASVLLVNEYWGLISFRMDWFDLLAVQGTLKSLLQHHSSKASIFRHSPFFMVLLSHAYTTTGKTIALAIQTFVSKGPYKWDVKQWFSKAPWKPAYSKEVRLIPCQYRGC